jgi:hypothetical protein
MFADKAVTSPDCCAADQDSDSLLFTHNMALHTILKPYGETTAAILGITK